MYLYYTLFASSLLTITFCYKCLSLRRHRIEEKSSNNSRPESLRNNERVQYYRIRSKEVDKDKSNKKIRKGKVAQDTGQKNDRLSSSNKTQNFTDSSKTTEKILNKSQNKPENNNKFESEFEKLVLNKYPGLFNEFDDTIQYRLNPELTSPNDPELNANVRFFRNEIKSRPFGYKITKFHQDFYGNYDFLESDHNFIQWLFPNRAQGLNYDSQPLQLHELETLKNDDEAKSRLLISFQMMLDFYGMKMDEFHQIKRNRAYKDRYENLLRRMHNNLRITRILKCLGDFELTEYQINFLKFLKDEIFVHKTLAKLAKTYTNFWIHTIKNDQDRENLKNEVVTLILSN